MKIVLRIIASMLVLTVLWTVILGFVRFGTRGAFPAMIESPLGIMTLAAWTITVVVGAPGSILLLRLRESGRVAAIVVFSVTIAYWVVGIVAFSTPQTAWRGVVAQIGMATIVLVVLFLPAARRACSGEAGSTVK